MKVAQLSSIKSAKKHIYLSAKEVRQCFETLGYSRSSTTQYTHMSGGFMESAISVCIQFLSNNIAPDLMENRIIGILLPTMVQPIHSLFILMSATAFNFLVYSKWLS